MFSIERVVLNNFRLFVGTHVFEIPAEPGLYNLTGKNLLYPRLGANDVGKSTLLDAIYWCLYGRTTRGLRGGEVVSWGEKNCRVLVTLNVGGDPAEIERHQNPNALIFHSSLGNKGHDQDIIDKYLRLSPEAFLYSVILPQFGEAFFDLTATEKLNLFSAIMDLDTWLERSQAADQRAKGLAEQRSKREQELARVAGQIDQINEDIDTFDVKETSFDDKQSEIIREMEGNLRKFETEFKFITEECKGAATGLLIAEEKIAKMAGKGICPRFRRLLPRL